MKKTTKRLVLLTLPFMLLVFLLIVTAACAPRAAEVSSGSSEVEEAAPMTIEWSPDVECGVCHTAEELSRTDTAALAGNHAPPTVSVELTCIDCHEDTTTLASVHENVEADPATTAQLKRTAVADETCTSAGCHDADLAERITATAQVTTFTDDDGTTVNPHDLPFTPEDNPTPGHEEVTCASCHSGHSVSEPESACYSCHHEHNYVYECYTCHNANV